MSEDPYPGTPVLPETPEFQSTTILVTSIYTVAWYPSSNAEGYLLYEDDVLIYNTTYTNEQVTWNNQGVYGYVVVAWNENGTSMPSDVLYALRMADMGMGNEPVSGTPTQVSPEDGFVHSTGEITFQWTTEEYAAYYIIQYSNDSSFSDDVHEVPFEETYYSLDVGDDEFPIYWRVRSLNYYFHYSDWSPVREITNNQTVWGQWNLTIANQTEWQTWNITQHNITEWQTWNITQQNITEWQVWNITQQNITEWQTWNITQHNITEWQVWNITQHNITEWQVWNITQQNITEWQVWNITQQNITEWQVWNITQQNITEWQVWNATQLNWTVWQDWNATQLNWTIWQDWNATQLNWTIWQDWNITQLNWTIWQDWNATQLNWTIWQDWNATQLNWTIWQNWNTTQQNITDWQQWNITQALHQNWTEWQEWNQTVADPDDGSPDSVPMIGPGGVMCSISLSVIYRRRMMRKGRVDLRLHNIPPKSL